jgi:hypothetical protein
VLGCQIVLTKSQRVGGYAVFLSPVIHDTVS